MNDNIRNFAIWVVIVLLMLGLFTLFQNPGQRTASQDISFTQFLSEVDSGRVRDVLLQGSEATGTFTDGRRFQTVVSNDPTLTTRLYGKGVSVTVQPPGSGMPSLISMLVSWLPFVALIGVWIFLSRGMRSNTGMSFGQQGEIESLKRQIADLQRQIDQMRNGPR